MWIYEQENWPNFIWNGLKIAELLAEVRHLEGRLLGRMESMGFSLCEDATLQILTEDVIKTSEIEGEKLDKEQVRSSIARRLGLDIGGLPQKDRNIESIVEVMLDATRNYNLPLTKERLFSWHAALFPTGRSGLQKITIGNWRNQESGQMQVVSGAYGCEQVHYEALSYERLEQEMTMFLEWFENISDLDEVLKAIIAHFWFVTIHPFDDGNGRIARALADMGLARAEKSKQRFYSMSAQIQHERKNYYNILEESQKGDLDITNWLEWSLHCLKQAIINSDKTLESVLEKAKFFKNNPNSQFNKRQLKIINRLLDGFEGNLTSSKWSKITKCSQDTALRDINDLLNKNILEKDKGQGRSTSYLLKRK